MSPAHAIGDTVDMELEDRYVESWDSAPNKVVYAPESDRMKSRYDYYVFDAAEFVKKFGSKSAGGSVKVQITNITSAVEHADDPSHAQPQGGFKKVHFACKILA